MRWIYKGIIFFSLFGIVNILYNEECFFALICAILLIVYMSYRAVKAYYDFEFWDDTYIPNRLNIDYDNYEYINYSNPSKHVITYGKTYNTNEINDIVKNIKPKIDKIEILETTHKTVNRPLTKKDKLFTTKADKKINKSKTDKNDNVVINPSEFNKDLIMLVNDNKLSKDICTIYDCIINSLKECNLPSSQICCILQGLPYIDLCGTDVIIYVNEKQLEGFVLSKIKRKIITKIKEKFEDKLTTKFENLKYISVFDYFNKNNAL